MDIKFYLSLFMRRIHYFLLFLALGSAVGVTLATVLPESYDAEALLLWEQATIETDGIETDANVRLRVLREQVLTRAPIIEMANQLDVYAPRPGEERVRMSGDEIVEDMRNRIGIAITGGAAFRRGPNEPLTVEITFAASDPQLAANVVNRVVELMEEQNERIGNTTTSDAVEFYRSQLRELDQQLSEVSARILAFQQAAGSAVPSQLEFNLSSRSAAQERLLGLQRDEEQLRNLRETFVRVYEETGTILGSQQEGANQTPEQRQLAALQSERANMALTLSDTNPRMRQLDAQIAQVQEVVNSQLAEQGAAVDPTAELLSPYELRLAEIDGQLEFITGQQSLIRTEIERLSVAINDTPANSVQIEAMQRDMANIRARYDNAVAEMAAAEMAAVVDRTNRGERLLVLENAVPARAPTSPNRPIIAAAGIGGGFFIGLAVIVLIELLNSSIRRPQQLTNKLGITPLGTIPNIRTRWEIARRRTIMIAAFATVLIALPAAMWFIHNNITPLDTVINGVLIRLGLPLVA